ncbi:hypothetical protein STEG23_001122 [Scotinomys teguina]
MIHLTRILRGRRGKSTTTSTYHQLCRQKALTAVEKTESFDLGCSAFTTKRNKVKKPISLPEYRILELQFLSVWYSQHCDGIPPRSNRRGERFIGACDGVQSTIVGKTWWTFNPQWWEYGMADYQHSMGENADIQAPRKGQPIDPQSLYLCPESVSYTPGPRGFTASPNSIL